MSRPQHDIIRDINSKGWFAATISGDKTPNWAYTVGLHHNFNHPEICIFGVDIKEMDDIVFLLADQVKNGRIWHTNKNYNEVLDKLPILFKQVTNNCKIVFFDLLHWFYGNYSFPIIQCFWPDSKKRFPWMTSFEESLRGFQPKLYKSHLIAADANATYSSIYPFS